MVRYYGYYSNKSRGLRKKTDEDDDIAHIIDTSLSDKSFRNSWARLIQKIYEVGPLLCPKCQGPMKIISFIKEQAVIKQILRHLVLWEVRNNGPPAPRLEILFKSRRTSRCVVTHRLVAGSGHRSPIMVTGPILARTHAPEIR